MLRNIAIVSDDPGWHGDQLSRSLQARNCQCAYLRLQDCGFDTDQPGQKALVLPVFEGHPDAIFVRGVPGGSLEQVVFYLDILHACEHLGIRVYNNVRSIERSVDKAMTSFLLHTASIPTPSTHAFSDLHEAYAFIRSRTGVGRRLVLKPLFGSQGKGLQLIQSPTDLQLVSEYHGVLYLQDFISAHTDQNRDWRLFVIGDQLVATMCRESQGWISNVAHGARCSRAELPDQVGEMAIAACRAVGVDYAGVDIMLDQTGEYLVTEVNSVPAWKGLQSVVEFDVADAIAAHFLSQLNHDLPEAPHLVQA